MADVSNTNNGVASEVDAVVQIIKLTKDHKMIWERKSILMPRPSHMAIEKPKSDASTPPQKRIVFIANFKGFSYKLIPPVNSVSTINTNPINTVIGQGVSISETRKLPMLQILDANGDPIYRFPPISALRDLLTAVRHQTSGVDTAFRSLFEPS
jgi:hypothetical protein